ncbi:coiled-coil domain-containing protein 9B isoform X2 [Hemicordylus capensis]|uniref:coiled-coil domain-containing protein 9B isoform X2 n=1 Tax=Hemicordylus capensis TaxID=884348 RepID=UPI0023035C1D|nr:coiled-coil domain-containing protein 9B isoform X2 [Hemicordylus capensis]
MSKMHRSDATVDDAVLRKKEQKDIELDKKIIALRKKNKALLRRYQETEEDRKRAEQEGMAITSRRARPEGLTITITKAHNGKRVVSEKQGSECLASPGEAPDISKEEGDQLVAFRRERRMHIAITMDNKSRVDEKRTVERRRSESDKHSESVLFRKERGKSPQKSPGDKSCTLTGRERSEYMRWKKERDQIDLERLARHKNARGEWRRAWDIEKSERMFEETKDGETALDCPHSKKGGRNAKKSQQRSLPFEGKGGGQRRTSTSEPASRALPVVSSKARGKDRLTGRARRWDAKEGEEIPFIKDEPDNQRSTNNEQLKGQTLVSEAVKEHNHPEGLEKSVHQQNPKEHSVFMPQAKKCGKSPTVGEDQSTDEKARRCIIQEVSASSMDEPEADPKFSKTVTGVELSPRSSCMNSSSCQGMAGSLLLAAGGALKEINSTFYEDGLDKNAPSERNPSEDCVRNLGELAIKAKVNDEVQV